MKLIFRLKAFLRFYTLIVIVAFLYSCNEEPTFMGSALLQDTVAIYPLSTTKDKLITNASSFLHHINTLNKGVIHIGKANGITALSLIRFSEPLKTSDNYDFFVNYSVDKIISCKLKLYTKRYTFGDSTNPNALSFKVYKAENYWSNISTWDTLEAFNIIDYSKAVGNFNGSVSQKDTMDNLEIEIDKEVFLDWAKKWYDYKKGDTSSIVWGLAFVPDENSSVIRQFSGNESASSDATDMTIIYLDTAGVQDTLILSKSIDKPFYKVPVLDSTDFSIQGALSLRGLLYFDVSMIPPKSAIHSAQLELTLNRDKVIFGNNELDSTLLAELLHDTASIDAEKFERSYYAERKDDKFYFTSIISAVETWNRGKGKNYLIFHPEGTKNERWELDKLTFYGPNEPDSTKRPVLKIIYSRISGK